MTSCDPWLCTTWVSRSSKVTWGHWPRLTSQWQIANRHMLSGISWGAESEFVVHCSQKRLQTTSSSSPRPIIAIRSIWILTVTAVTASGVMPFYLGTLRMLNIATGFSNYTSILFRIERGTRWWRFQIATTHTFAAMSVKIPKMSIFAKIWPLTWLK